jgi:hypothetical protein
MPVESAAAAAAAVAGVAPTADMDAAVVPSAALFVGIVAVGGLLPFCLLSGLC